MSRLGGDRDFNREVADRVQECMGDNNDASDPLADTGRDGAYEGTLKGDVRGSLSFVVTGRRIQSATATLDGRTIELSGRLLDGKYLKLAGRSGIHQVSLDARVDGPGNFKGRWFGELRRRPVRGTFKGKRRR